MKAGDVRAMRMVSSDKVMAIAQQAGVRAGADVDGYYLPDTVQHIFEAGRQTDVPVVTGSMANDIGTNVALRGARTLAAYRQGATDAFGPKADEFLRLWPAQDDATAARQAEQVGRESGFGLAAHNWARLQAATGKQPAYLYMMTKVQPFAPDVTFSDFDPKTAGAYHMGDVPYVLGTYEALNLFRTTRNWTDADRKLSDMLQDLLVAYAKTGAPQTAGIRMVRYDAASEQRTVIGDDIHLEKPNAAGIAFLRANPATPARPSAPPTAPRPTF
jgi:para-nitrobenzyl esterase